MVYSSLTLPQVYNEAAAIAADARTLFGHLNAQQLNWKPSADSWSVAQCLEQSLEEKRPETIVITSPFVSTVVYSLLDAFRLVVAHERRHFAQARRVMEVNGFPRLPE